MKTTEEFIRHILVSVTVLIAVQSFAELPPDLVCEAGSEIQVLNSSLSVSKYESDVLYRFSDGKLYLSSSEREEYLYGELSETAFLRYVTGNKSIIFGDTKFATAISTNFDDIETRIVQLRCIKT